jgi:hypothetical protein
MRTIRSLLFIGLSSALISGCAYQPEMITTASDSQIATWIEQQIIAPERKFIGDEKTRYITGKSDINHDGNDEYLILMQQRYFCGSGGCTAYLFSADGKVLQRMTVTDTPILLANTQSNGWQDFIVWSNGHYRLMRFNGNSYPTNPSREPIFDRSKSNTHAKQLVTETELYQQDGYAIKSEIPSELWAPESRHYFSFKHYGDPENYYRASVDMSTEQLDISIEPIEEELRK